MANVYDYTFQNMSRIGNDSCCIDQNTIQNAESCNYLLQNYFSQDCTMKNTKSLALSQPGMIYNGTQGVGIGGCNIDDNSNLMLGGIQTHPRCRIDLYQRPFATVPYLGRGSVDPVIEAQMMQGELNTNKRTVTNLTEKSYLKYNITPLIPSVKESIQNPTNLIEGDASQGWIRGGLPSREMTRDRNE
jgi:hypothetical protein